jgi:hypothetical protein
LFCAFGGLSLSSVSSARSQDNHRRVDVVLEIPKNRKKGEKRIFLFSAQTAQKAKWRGKKGKLDCFSVEIFIKYSNDIQISYASERSENDVWVPGPE